MKKRIYWLRLFCLLSLSFLLCALFSTPVYAAAEVYRVAGDRDFPPYEYVDADGNFKGFNVDLLKAISLVTGMEFEFIPMKWEHAYVSVHQGQADLIQGMKESEQRKSIFLFSESLLTSSQSIFVLDQNNTVRNESDLKGKTIALNKEDISYREISEIENVIIAEYDSLGEALQGLLDGEVDALIGNTLTVNYLSKEKNAIDLVKIVGRSMNEQKYAIAVHRSNPELLKKLNDGILEIQNNGMYDSLYRKWFGAPIKNATSNYEVLWKYTLGIIGALVALVTMIKSANNKLKRMIAVKTEEQKALMHELRHYDKLQFMNKIISSIAHEIRNPLTSIKIYTNQMPQKIDNRAFLLAASEDIPQEIDRVDRLLKEFMEYASPKKPVIATINLYDELMSAIKLAKFHMDHMRIRVSVDRQLFVTFDVSQFKQVVLNLLLNSHEALRNADDAVVEITAQERGHEIVLTFQDNGCGMSRENLPHIFEPFYTTKEFGNGVGMFVVKQIIDDNGGRITAESDGPHQGMRIHMSLKRGDEDEA
ncbi:transporter substrate-binding domain-containing protein [Anoxynatronum buryatiense]|uniref:histidine kinase n=1 Tax=Anoxynatronum buryatiense TaxID=489973 RepID=A0AA46AKA0_9CLOT|nr:transporter substrate-binding domain-containing protein [Anoxynatronum buryatiense]SMP68868.1 amino acid-binding domain sensor histidine kinase [Anoxynatronum buryatiense]